MADTTATTETTSTDEGKPTPPWGTDEEFTPERAWTLIQNLRGDVAKHKTAAAQAAERADSLTAQVQALTKERDEALAASKTASEELSAQQVASTKERLLMAAGLDADKYAPMLTGDGEEAWAAQVEALTALRGDSKPAPKPDPAQSANSKPAVDERAALAEQIFGN